MTSIFFSFCTLKSASGIHGAVMQNFMPIEIDFHTYYDYVPAFLYNTSVLAVYKILFMKQKIVSSRTTSPTI